jgi:hypothetical protein
VFTGAPLRTPPFTPSRAPASPRARLCCDTKTRDRITPHVVASGPRLTESCAIGPLRRLSQGLHGDAIRLRSMANPRNTERS